MKSLLLVILLSFGLLVSPASSTTLGLASVKQAVYLHGSDSDPVIDIVDVPFVTSYSDPEWRFNAICQPFIPAADKSWKEPQDINLASLYKITVSGTYAEGADVEVVIDASKAVVPEGYPFTLDQVLDAVSTCVKLMYPARPADEGKFTIKVVPAAAASTPAKPAAKAP
ncbi:MAG: hypothetical protein ACAI34_03910 [Verrucomicrobium sp.]